LSDAVGGIGICPAKYFGAVTIQGPDVQTMTGDKRGQLTEDLAAGFSEIVQGRKDISEEAKSALLLEIANRKILLLELLSLADIAFSLIRKSARLTDDDIKKMEVLFPLLRTSWENLYGSNSFPCKWHTLLVHALAQAKRFRAIGICDETVMEKIHADDNRDNARYANIAKDFNRRETIKSNLRDLRDGLRKSIQELFKVTEKGPREEARKQNELTVKTENRQAAIDASLKRQREGDGDGNGGGEAV
jgi:hypothetical protein